MRSLHKNDTWELTELPKGNKAIGCKWEYAKKQRSLKEDTVRYKARLETKGYAQQESIDYNEIFSLVVKHSSIRILLALIAQYELDLEQLDVKTAFLHGDLDEEIYMSQPMEFKTAGKENTTCKLKNHCIDWSSLLGSGTRVSTASSEENGTHVAIRPMCALQ